MVSCAHLARCGRRVLARCQPPGAPRADRHAAAASDLAKHGHVTRIILRKADNDLGIIGPPRQTADDLLLDLHGRFSSGENTAGEGDGEGAIGTQDLLNDRAVLRTVARSRGFARGTEQDRRWCFPNRNIDKIASTQDRSQRIAVAEQGCKALRFLEAADPLQRRRIQVDQCDIAPGMGGIVVSFDAGVRRARPSKYGAPA